jgi:hypothetical protein
VLKLATVPRVNLINTKHVLELATVPLVSRINAKHGLELATFIFRSSRAAFQSSNEKRVMEIAYLVPFVLTTVS